MRSLVTLSLLVSLVLGCDGKSTTPPPSSPPGSTIDELCVHIMEIMRDEFGDAGVTGVPLTDQERVKFLSSCASEQETERAKLGTKTFDAYVACAMAAATMANLMECDESE